MTPEMEERLRKRADAPLEGMPLLVAPETMRAVFDALDAERRRVDELEHLLPTDDERALLERIRAGTHVVVCVKHLREAMRFYPPFDHDTKTRLIGDQLRSQIVAAQEETQS